MVGKGYCLQLCHESIIIESNRNAFYKAFNKIVDFGGAQTNGQADNYLRAISLQLLIGKLDSPLLLAVPEGAVVQRPRGRPHAGRPTLARLPVSPDAAWRGWGRGQLHGVDLQAASAYLKLLLLLPAQVVMVWRRWRPVSVVDEVQVLSAVVVVAVVVQELQWLRAKGCRKRPEFIER